MNSTLAPQPSGGTATEYHIAYRVYNLCRARDGEQAHDVDDWLQTKGTAGAFTASQCSEEHSISQPTGPRWRSRDTHVAREIEHGHHQENR